MAHSPNIIHFVERQRLPYHLLLVGHTHGGQIRWRQRTWGSYNHFHVGLRKMPDGRYFHISPGLGTVKLPLRFNCPPEMAVFRISSAAERK